MSRYEAWMDRLDPNALPVLPCMKSHYDGAHCGLGDWYPEIERGIAQALRNRAHNWTTGWYSSKKEIASARISRLGKQIMVEVSVSNDFDTPGHGSGLIPFTNDLEKIRKAIYSAWDEAEKNQDANEPVELWCIQHKTMHYSVYIGGVPQGKGRMGWSWVESYIVDKSGDMLGRPPGDEYHQWGFQGDTEIPKDIKQCLERAILNHRDGYSYRGWKLRLSKREEATNG